MDLAVRRRGRAPRSDQRVERAGRVVTGLEHPGHDRGVAGARGLLERRRRTARRASRRSRSRPSRAPRSRGRTPRGTPPGREPGRRQVGDRGPVLGRVEGGGVLDEGHPQLVGHPPSLPPGRHRVGGSAPCSSSPRVILTGGTGARLGGVDKATLEYAGRSLLDRALDAVGLATPRSWWWGRRTPDPAPGPVHPGGPAVRGPGRRAARRAGRPRRCRRRPGRARRRHAAGLPRRRSPGCWPRLAGHDGAFLVDDRRPTPAGRRACARTGAGPARPRRATPHGLPLHRLLADLDLAERRRAGRTRRATSTPGPTCATCPAATR